MAYTTIDKPSDYFNTKLYTGNGGTNAQTGVGFQQDFTWIKARSNAENHNLFDAVRGATKRIRSNGSEAEDTRTTSLTAFGTDGFTLGSGSQVNTNGWTFASWNWKANGGTTSSNSDGSITSTVQANTTAGFSIVTFTGTGSNATVGHGLGSKPEWFLIKNRDGTISGHDKEIIDLIIKRTGLKINLKLGNWSDMQERAKNREFDGLSSAGYNKERELYYNSSIPYIYLTTLVIVKKDNQKKIYKLKDLANKNK